MSRVISVIFKQNFSHDSYQLLSLNDKLVINSHFFYFNFKTLKLLKLLTRSL